MSKTNWKNVGLSLIGKCPKCREGDIYPSLRAFKLKDKCDVCGLALSQNDNADGPAVFVMAILCFMIVPSALALDLTIQPPIWVHAVLWGSLTILLSILGLKPMTGLIMHLQFKHRPGDFGKS